MRYTFQPMTQADAEAIAVWCYEGPYAFYNMDQDPEDLAELLDAGAREGHYFRAQDEQGRLVGFLVCEPQGEEVELGFGLRPDLTGHGRGQGFVMAGMAYARERFAPRRLRLSVAEFNQRAIRVYERAGFSIVRHFVQHTNGADYPFVEMVHE